MIHTACLPVAKCASLAPFFCGLHFCLLNHCLCFCFSCGTRGCIGFYLLLLFLWSSSFSSPLSFWLHGLWLVFFSFIWFSSLNCALLCNASAKVGMSPASKSNCPWLASSVVVLWFQKQLGLEVSKAFAQMLGVQLHCLLFSSLGGGMYVSLQRRAQKCMNLIAFRYSFARSTHRILREGSSSKIKMCVLLQRHAIKNFEMYASLQRRAQTCMKQANDVRGSSQHTKIIVLPHRICFPRSVFSDRARCNPTALSMELVDEWYQIIESKTPPKVKMLNKGLNVALDAVKRKGRKALLLTHVKILFMQAHGKVCSMCLRYDVVRTVRQGTRPPVQERDPSALHLQKRSTSPSFLTEAMGRPIKLHKDTRGA